MPPGDNARTGTAADDSEDIVYNVPTKNAFDVLRDAQRSQGRDVYSAPRQPRKPPPITIVKRPDQAIDIDGLRAKLNKTTNQFTIQRSTNGAKIYPTNTQAHTALLNVVNTDDHQFTYYTHPTNDVRYKRFVLYGLDKCELDSVRRMLHDVALHPTDIKYMFVKDPKMDAQCNYLLYFQPTDRVTLTQLKEIKSLEQVIINWAHYKPKASGVSPCRRCCNFGHGSSNCGMPQRCIVCGDDHSVSNCPLIKAKHASGSTSLHSKHIKCANCGANHTATFRECPARLVYIEDLKKRRKSPAQLIRYPYAQKPAQVRQQTSNREATTNYSSPMRPPVAGVPSYAWPSLNPAQEDEPPQQPQQPQHPHQPHQQTNNNLYSNQECQSMIDQLFNNLQNCESKQHQAKVIADFAIKYFCKFT